MKQNFWPAIKTSSGLYALEEAYQSAQDTVLVFKADGELATATYVYKKTEVVDGRQAVIPIHPGYFVMKGRIGKNDKEEINLYTVMDAYETSKGPAVVMNKHNRLRKGKWDHPIPEYMEQSYRAMHEKLFGPYKGEVRSQIKKNKT